MSNLTEFVERLIAAIRLGSSRTLQRDALFLGMFNNPQLNVLMDDVLHYAADNAWPQAEVLCRFFLDIQDRSKAEHFYWIEDAASHLRSAAKAASRNQSLRHDQLKAIVVPMLAEAESEVMGLITPRHSLTREIFSMSHVDATLKVADAFSTLNETFKDGRYEVSVYKAISMLKSLKTLWNCKPEE